MSKNKASVYSVVVFGPEVDEHSFNQAKQRLSRKSIIAVRPNDVKQDDIVVANCRNSAGLNQVYDLCKV